MLELVSKYPDLWQTCGKQITKVLYPAYPKFTQILEDETHIPIPPSSTFNPGCTEGISPLLRLEPAQLPGLGEVILEHTVIPMTQLPTMDVQWDLYNGFAEPIICLWGCP